MDKGLQAVPEEILQQIILYLPFNAVIRLEQTCRKTRKVCSGPVVWRQLCRTHFHFWSPIHKIRRKLSLPLGDTDWKSLFMKRYRLDQEIDRRFNDILAHLDERNRKIESIADLGWDAKDALLRQSQVENENVDDVLARRWYAKSILACLHRSIAISRWIALEGSPAQDVPLENALAAFDVFVSQDLHQREDHVSAILDQIKSDFLSKNAIFCDLSLKGRATVIARYLRQHHWVGITGDQNARYHDIQNNFIGFALSESPHSSLPLVSAAIYCALARRLDIDARPCGFPFHVLVVIQDTGQEAVYMDPFRLEDPVEKATLIFQLQTMGASSLDYQKLLRAASVSNLVARSARNIIASIQSDQLERSTTSNLPTRETSLYAALWALLLTASSRFEWSEQQITYLDALIRLLQAQFSTDVWLAQKYLLPTLGELQPGLGDFLAQIRSSVDSRKARKPRRAGFTDNVSYRVGQVFHHKRYHYHAIIIGWDVKCEASERWIDQMGVRALPKGQDQSFYHALVEDKSVRYVAQENIEVVEQEPIARLVEIAGQYFKRWDSSTMTFVSNVTEEYPDN